VTDSSEAAVAEPNAGLPSAQAPHEEGWYLYGITRLNPGESAPAGTGATGHDIVDAPRDLGPAHERVQLLRRGSLAAVVRQVPLADFTAEALQARLGDPTGLELLVQAHNAVISAVHRQLPVLPAKFGAVYARLDDVATAMDERHDALLAQLERVDGCDEWAVHVYVNQRIVQAQARAEQATDPALQQLAATSPGRAYFLRRKQDDALAAKTAQVIEEVGLGAYERLAGLAADVVAGWADRPLGDDGEAEVLRAALLVRRERSDDFVAAVRACAEDGKGWRCTYSGPWPPYSFAAIPGRDGDDRPDA